MRFFILFFIFPIVFFGEKISTFYGSIEVNEPVVLELIKSEAFQRLKGIHQYGVSYYNKRHREEYTRYAHSLGVFAILKVKGLSLKEQIAGLLHDISHTAFSHVGDWVFGKNGGEKDYQNCIHKKFLENFGIGKILSKYGYKVEEVLPLEEYFPALEKKLPNLCADRIDYNIQGAYYKGFITKKEALEILEDLQFVDNHWVCRNKKLIAKIVRFSLFMTKNCWGSVYNSVSSYLFAEAIVKALEENIISKKELHFGTDELVWKKLVSSKNSFIKNKLKMLLRADALYRVLERDEKADFVIRSKFRGINPLVLHKGKRVRLTEVDEKLSKEYNEHKKEIGRGWRIKCLKNFPKTKSKLTFDQEK